jgi:putative transposase
VRKVQDKGKFTYQGRIWKISKAFRGYAVGLRPTSQDGCFDVYFCQHKIALINLNDPQ